jgi:hypothetical protein
VKSVLSMSSTSNSSGASPRLAETPAQPPERRGSLGASTSSIERSTPAASDRLAMTKLATSQHTPRRSPRSPPKQEQQPQQQQQPKQQSLVRGLVHEGSLHLCACFNSVASSFQLKHYWSRFTADVVGADGKVVMTPDEVAEFVRADTDALWIQYAHLEFMEKIGEGQTALYVCIVF